MGLNKRRELHEVVTGLNSGMASLFGKLAKRFPAAKLPLRNLYDLSAARLWRLAEGNKARSATIEEGIQEWLAEIASVEPEAPVAELAALWQHNVAVVTLFVTLHS